MNTTEASVLLRQLRGLVTAGKRDQLPDRQLLQQFVARHEETAFEALVKRHGPVVWGVCRRVLRNTHDAEDAFQATFLVLAQKAGSVGRQDSVGGWLHRVAYHAALKARARAANRQRYERQAEAPCSSDLLSEVTGRELLAVLDEELARLPDRFRAPLVLCYLEGNTCDEAARLLHWSARTLKRRLGQGREWLRARLERRGLSLPAALLAAGLTASATPAPIPAALISAAVQGGLRAVTGQGAAGTAPAVLAASVLRSMTLARIPGAAAIVLLTAVLLALGAFVLATSARAPQSQTRAPAAPQDQPRPRPRQASAEDAKTMTIAGRVRDAGGKPVAGAELTVVARGWNFAVKEYRVLGKGKTDQDGRFRLTTPRFPSGEGFLLAGKPGYGLSQQSLNPEAERQEITLRLPREQILRGRLLDLQAQPAAGVQVAVMWIGARDDAGLYAPSGGLAPWPKPALSDAQGRFTIAGLPQKKEVWLQVQSERFAWQTQRLPTTNGTREMNWVLSPARLLEGKVVHADTGRPAAHARLALAPAGLGGRTDRDGRFKLSLPAVEQRYLPPLTVYPAAGEPYLPVRQEVVWPRGAVKHTVEVKLPRGVLVRGKVTEAPSGRPVFGAGVQFVPRATNNPNVLTGWQHLAATGKDGAFQLAVLPGPGHLLVSGPGLDFIQEEVGHRVITDGKPGGYRLHANGLVKLDLAPNSRPKEVTVTLRRGVTVRGRVLDPQGKPVAKGVMICRLLRTAIPSQYHVEVRDGLFALHGCDPGKDYPVYFLDPENGWGATFTLAGKQAGGAPVTVRLAPCGRAVARFVDAQGQPRQGYPMKSLLLHLVITPGPPYGEAVRKGVLAADQEFAVNLVSRKERVGWKRFRTDAEGRFTYAGLIPGATYRLSVIEPRKGEVLKKEFQARAGKTLALGDVVVPGR
jgi:RNA polymerase sigma factor (sigma-70 family)